MKEFIKNMPVLGRFLLWFLQRIGKTGGFAGSKTYWEERYASGGNSGSGSYGRLALYKAAVINDFVLGHKVHSVIEFGCGDGNQLNLAKYPKYYGLDVSAFAVKLCREKFKNDTTKRFQLYNGKYNGSEKCDLAISLDVIYHLIEDDVFEKYMNDLFHAATSFVIIYASDADGEQRYHEKMRKFTVWISNNITDWVLDNKIKNPYPYDIADPDNTSQSDFYIYKKSHTSLA